MAYEYVNFYQLFTHSEQVWHVTLQYNYNKHTSIETIAVTLVMKPYIPCQQAIYLTTYTLLYNGKLLRRETLTNPHFNSFDEINFD